jgi:peroxiredoxin
MKFDVVSSSKVGQLAPPLVVTDQGGREVSLAEFRGNWLLLVFHRHLA